MKKFFALACALFVLNIAGCSSAPAPKATDFWAQDAETYHVLTDDYDGAPNVEAWKKVEASVEELKAFLMTKASLALQAEDISNRETCLQLAADFPERNLRIFVYDAHHYLGASGTPLWVFMQANRNGKINLIPISDGALVPAYITTLVVGDTLLVFLTEAMNSGETVVFAFGLSTDTPQTRELGIDYADETFSIRAANQSGNDINKDLKMSRIQYVDETPGRGIEITQTPDGFAVNGVPFPVV